MTTQTVTLADFLLARIAEDERDARDATPGPWTWLTPDETAGSMGARNLRADGDIPVMVGAIDFPIDLRFIARHDPARVLAECEAKRRVVALHNPCEDWSYGDSSTCPELCALAAVYADHPDYRDEWRP